jgi:hypothetical protein
MDGTQLTTAARAVYPFLDWIESRDGDGHVGSGLPFVAATVGTTLGPATLCLSWVGGNWLAELNITRADMATAERKHRSMILQTAGSTTAAEALEDILQLSEAAGSFTDGLDVAKEAWSKTDSGRLSAIGLVSPHDNLG